MSHAVLIVDDEATLARNLAVYLERQNYTVRVATSGEEGLQQFAELEVVVTFGEVLGSGDARRRFQRFTLQQGPLTHVPAATVDGSASTLRVSVDGVTWTEVDSLCGAAATARVPTVELPTSRWSK